MLLGISSRTVGLRQVASRLPNVAVQAAVSKPLMQQRALSFASSTTSRSIAFRPCSAVAPSSFSATPLVRPSQLPLIPARFFSEGKELVVNVPFLADSVTSADLQKIMKNVGDHVAIDEVIISLETDKVAVEVRAPADGVITEFLAKEGDKLTVGQPLFKLRPGAAPAAKPEAPKPAAPAPSAPTPSAPAPSAPAPKPEAPKPAAQPAAAAPAASAAPSSKPAAAAPSSSARVENRVPMKRIRQRIAERLKDAQNTNALLTTFQEADLEKLIELRETFQEAFTKKHGVKLGFMSAFIRASTIALQEQPVINAVIDGTDIVYRDFVDISVAVATPKGLVVPVIRDCQKLSFADIEKTLGDLGDRARKDKIAIEEMAGGTFTISNGGVYGSLMGTPIVNPPQSAILGMHGIFKRPVVRTINGQDQVVIRPMMYLALTYDHRLIDGREAVTFLRKVKDLVEDPRRILLDL